MVNQIIVIISVIIKSIKMENNGVTDNDIMAIISERKGEGGVALRQSVSHREKEKCRLYIVAAAHQYRHVCFRRGIGMEKGDWEGGENRGRR